ncbi:LPXTG cell wall anchor domain-containing protein [Galactobacter valiniphilus]|uniref:LPXTG cell wall anchor domain-containing protein n=1 Tax=Galactobacter valiniphilus TaxID=2676122 RepID=UPI003734F0F3
MPTSSLRITAGLALVTVAGLAALTAAPAHATPTPGLEVSSDGTHFAQNSDAALFGDLGRVVPGSRGKDTVWFRNGTDLEIRLRLQLSDGWTDSAPLAEATTLTVKGLGTTRSTRLGEPLATGTCTVVSRDYLLQPGKTLRLDAQIAVSTALTDREGALKSLGFSLKAFAADASVELPATCGVASPELPGPSTPPPSGDPSLPPPTAAPPAVKPPLAQTGFGAGFLAATGAALAGLGLLLARRRRGKRNA